ncbi:MAG: bacterio-opsin activator, partial [Halorientalis sp.]
MPHAKLTITIPEPVWISEVSRTYPDARFRVLAATANDTAGVARIKVFGDEPATVCETISEYGTLTST